jgi:hypothetical protein
VAAALLNSSDLSGELGAVPVPEEAHPDAKKMHRLSMRERIAFVRFVLFMFFSFRLFHL